MKIMEVQPQQMCNVYRQSQHGAAAPQQFNHDVNPHRVARIYYGLFVAESKFRSDRANFVELIQKQDSEGLMAAITKPKVEKKIIERVVLKARSEPDAISDQLVLKLMPSGHSPKMLQVRMKQPRVKRPLTIKCHRSSLGVCLRSTSCR